MRRRSLVVLTTLAATLLVAPPPASAAPYTWEDPRAGRNLTYAAVAQVGRSYCWGGGDLNGPTVGDPAVSKCNLNTGPGFDCSGLVHYSLGRAGMPMSDRNAHAFSALGTAVSAPVPGDLLFYDRYAPWGTYEHVAIYLGRNWDNGRVELVEASGDIGQTAPTHRVRVRTYTPGEARLIKRVFH